MSSLTVPSFPEQLTTFTRTLGRVTNLCQLAEFTLEINPVFDFLSSAIVCLREGLEGTEYLICLPEKYHELEPLSFEEVSFQIIDNRSDPVLYEFLEKAKEDKFISFLNFESYQSPAEMHPYLARCNEKGGGQAIGYHLLQDQHLIGFWLTIPNTHSQANSFSADLLEPFLTQMSATVNLINISSELTDKKKEGEILMSLNIDLAATRDKKNLLSVIRGRLQPLMTFSHHFVCKVDESETTIAMLLSDTQSASRFHPLYESINADKFPLAGSIYEKIIRSTEPLIVDLVDLAGQGNLPPQFQVNFDSGIEKVIMVALRVNLRLQGIWTVAFSHNQPILASHLQLIKTVAAPISIAVANIRANDSLLKKEKERERIMAMSFELTAIRHKKELIDTLKAYLPKMFDFQRLCIFLDNYSSPEEPFLCFSKVAELQEKDYYSDKLRPAEGATDFMRMLDIAESTVIDIGPLISAYPELKFLSSAFEKGAVSLISISLNNDNRSIGMMIFFLAQGMQFPSYHHHALQVISYQIATSIADLLLNENLRRKEQEKELLLALSEDIAAVRDKKQLTKVIKNRLKPILGFAHFALGVKSPDNSIISFLADPDSKSKRHPDYYTVFKQKREKCEDFIDYINQSPYPVVLNKTNVAQFDELPDVVHINFESGVKEILIAKLFDGVSIFGYCFFFFDRAGMIFSDQFSLVRGIANQFSTAIYNIRANLEIISREKDNELLISLSKKTAGVRNLGQLIELISEGLRPVFNFEQSYIAIPSEGNTTLGMLSPTSGAPAVLSQYLFEKEIPISTDFYQLLETSTKPISIDLRSAKWSSLGKISTHFGLNHAVVCSFVNNDNFIGVWIMLYRESAHVDTGSFRLMQGVSDQLSNSLANIYFNDRLNQREQEKTSLLQFTQAIAGVQDRFQLRAIFNSYLKNLCMIDDVSLHWFSDDKQSQSCYFWDQSVAGAADFYLSRITDRNIPANDTIFSPIIRTQSQQHFKTIELAEMTDFKAYVDLLSQQGCEYIVGVPILRGKEIAGVLFVKEFDTDTADQPLFSSLCAQLAIAVSNLVSSERIIRQLSQIRMYQQRLEEEKIYLKQELETSHHYSEIIGESGQINEVFRLVSQVAASDSTVLILGETGTGKELIARAIHGNSPRRNRLLVKVNCAALPANLIESELFGHEKGAFTGATERRIGKFELANGGSLFLDEIGEMPPELQVKLLRALQEREIERVGGRGILKVDVRIITATNRNLEQQVAEGKFRSDLYFRLSTFPIHLPALRDRKSDIPLLAMHFLNRFSKRSGKDISLISQRAMEELIRYNWPGNVRELEHQIERSVIMADGHIIKSFHLPVFGLNDNGQFSASGSLKTIDDNERELIIRTLKHCHGKVSGKGGAAELLGVPSTTLNAKIKRLGIKKNFSR